MPSEMKRLRQLEVENAKLKKLVADLSLNEAMLQDVLTPAVPVNSKRVGMEMKLLVEAPNLQRSRKLDRSLLRRGSSFQRVPGSRRQRESVPRNRSVETYAVGAPRFPYPGGLAVHVPWTRPCTQRKRRDDSARWGKGRKAPRYGGLMAVREGFEPSIRFHVYTRSRRAPSTTRPPHRIPEGEAGTSYAKARRLASVARHVGDPFATRRGESGSSPASAASRARCAATSAAGIGRPNSHPWN